MISVINTDSWSTKKEKGMCKDPEEIQSNKSIVCAVLLPLRNPIKMESAIMNDPKTVPLASMPTKFLGICLVPNPKMIKPIRGRTGISQTNCTI